MISFQLYSGVTGRNGTMPIPMMPTRTRLPRLAWKPGIHKRLRSAASLGRLDWRRGTRWRHGRCRIRLPSGESLVAPRDRQKTPDDSDEPPEHEERDDDGEDSHRQRGRGGVWTVPKQEKGGDSRDHREHGLGNEATDEHDHEAGLVQGIEDFRPRHGPLDLTRDQRLEQDEDDRDREEMEDR